MNQQITLIQNKAIRQLLVGLNAAADLALSVHQYECFLRCAAEEGKGLAISTIAGLADTTLNQKEYAHFKHALNRLMDGAPRRGRSGLQLLYRGDQASSVSSLAARRAREVGVTDKGKELVRLTGQITPMIRVLQEARGYQVATTLQLYAFLICALNSGESLQNALAKDYGGVEPTDARYQRIYGAIRQIR
ncbi:MAG: hypothetical protein IBX50_18305 [Marinospirillum sp.]|uniref:hypothetical protein n=1 Tax=Marinospirillum sp. TaxID=2183934 RepID=UPI0019F04F02|nr:hypothetical protein [Marinospirillum sp.]MBE0508639.1 hypothetical protein [Marinospirillum sp.]